MQHMIKTKFIFQLVFEKWLHVWFKNSKLPAPLHFVGMPNNAGHVSEVLIAGLDRPKSIRMPGSNVDQCFVELCTPRQSLFFCIGRYPLSAKQKHVNNIKHRKF